MVVVDTKTNGWQGKEPECFAQSPDNRPEPVVRNKRTAWGYGRQEDPVAEFEAWKYFHWKYLSLTALLVPAFSMFYLFGWTLNWITLVLWIVLTVALFLPLMCLAMILHSRFGAGTSPYNGQYIKFTDPAFESEWKGKKIPVLILYEAYFAGKLDIVGDLLEAMYDRYSWVSFTFTMGHVKFLLGKFVPELLVHSREQDKEQVTDHYDRGNDFYGSFLGDSMIYTSAVFQDENDTLEVAQHNKLELVFKKIHLRKGETLLDIGCGWGTLVKHAAKWGADATGVTLAQEQVNFGMKRIKNENLGKLARMLKMDYRDIPTKCDTKKFNKITCLEMAEHVGIRKFQSFLLQVSDMLEDDGIFYLQIAGLRRAFQYEDFQWGVFMGTHVFPGADASCPLGWVVNQCESAGFEIHSVETVGIHYSATIKCWYDNWKSNRAYIVKKYNETWYRKWLWFLAWSVLSPEEGMATCFQIVLHKNTRQFDRKRFIAERARWNV
jgi:sphingolipid C9-methyltransferase